MRQCPIYEQETTFVSRYRKTAAVMAAALAASALAACGSDSTDAGETSGGPWTYTDASGKTVTAESTPTRIIAHAGEAAALMSFGIKPVGIYGDVPVKDDPSLKNLDLSGITILGETWGEIDIEKAATLNPDLIVADWWPVEKAYSGMEEGVKEESEKIRSSRRSSVRPRATRSSRSSRDTRSSPRAWVPT